MDSLCEAPWWSDFLSRLRQEPLEALAGEYGASVADLVAALCEASLGNAVTDEPWWPEVVRRVDAGDGIRAMARLFQTKPRRIRRGLARAGLRVGGVAVGDQGIEALVEYRDRLGKEPDVMVATAAGVTTEAVQGARHRLGIPAFRPPEAEIRMAAPVVRKPRPSATKRRADLNVPEVIRRPSLARMGRLPRAADPPEAEESTSSALPMLPRATAADEPERPTARGRRRIVRPDATREAAPVASPEESRPKRRRKVSPGHSEVRLVPADEVDVSDLVARLQASNLRKAMVSPSQVREPSAQPAPPAPGPAPSAPGPAPSAPGPAPSAPVKASSTPPQDAVEPTRPMVDARVGWRVSLAGEVLPFLLVAPDLPQAIGLLAAQLSPDEMSLASVWEAGLLLN